MPLFSEVDGCLWSTEQRLPNSGRKERKLVVWACPSCHFILCQKSPRFTRQTLDRGHILGFLDLHGCPDVSMPSPTAQNQPATDSLVRQQSTPPPPPTPLTHAASLQHLHHCVLENSLTTGSSPPPPPHPCSLFHYHSMCLHERHSFSNSAVITVIHVYDSRR